MSTQHPDEAERPESSTNDETAATAPLDDVAPAEQPPTTGGPQPEAAGAPLPPDGSPVPAYAPPATASSGGTSNRSLWIGLGIGGAVVAALVLVGGVAFGMVLRHNDGVDHVFRGPMMAGQPDRDADGNGSGAPPGGGGYGMDGRSDEGPGGAGGQGFGPPAGIPGGLGQLGGGLHGSMVVPDGSGYTTVAMQRGTVTRSSTSSLTVKSSDGYTATYRVTGSTQVLAPAAQGATGTIADLSQGDAVSVLARGSTSPLSAQVVALG